MKNLIEFIQEGLKITSKTKVNDFDYTEDEMRHDYKIVSGAYEKAEKQFYATKYGIQSNKIHEIGVRIAEFLRDNRHKKKKFDELDFSDFYHLGIPEKYDKLKEYLDKEPKEFLDFLYEHYDKMTTKTRYRAPSSISINDRHQIKRYNQIKKYLQEEYNEKFN